MSGLEGSSRQTELRTSHNGCFMLTVAGVTLSHPWFQDQGARWLKLVGGSVMVGLCMLRLLEQEWFRSG